MPPQLPQRTRRELRSAATHVVYEVIALQKSAATYRRTGGRFAVEAALLHARNVIEFFMVPNRRRRSHSDGVYAEHYVDRARWRQLRWAFNASPNKYYAAMCAQVAHISVSRSSATLRVAFTRPLVADLAAHLRDAWVVFEREVGATPWHPTFSRAAKRWNRAI